MSDSVQYSVEDGVAAITLNRPHVMNALDAEMIRRLRAVCEQVERDEALLSDTFDAQRALDAGLVNRVVSAEQLAAETARMAQRLALGATRAFSETKQLVNRSYERTLTAQLEAEEDAFARCAATRDFAEGVTAFVEKRKAEFKGN